MVILQRHAFAIANSADEAAKRREILQRLSKSLAYVYTDVLEFCDGARNLENTKIRYSVGDSSLPMSY